MFHPSTSQGANELEESAQRCKLFLVARLQHISQHSWQDCSCSSFHNTLTNTSSHSIQDREGATGEAYAPDWRDLRRQARGRRTTRRHSPPSPPAGPAAAPASRPPPPPARRPGAPRRSSRRVPPGAARVARRAARTRPRLGLGGGRRRGGGPGGGARRRGRTWRWGEGIDSKAAGRSRDFIVMPSCSGFVVPRGGQGSWMWRVRVANLRRSGARAQTQRRPGASSSSRHGVRADVAAVC